MTEAQKKQLMGAAISLAMVYAVWKMAPHQAIKAAALGVGGVVVAKQLPYVRDSLA